MVSTKGRWSVSVSDIYIYIYDDLHAAIGDSVLLFADDMKMVFSRSKSSKDLPINPNKCSQFPAVSTAFSIRKVNRIRDLRVTLDTTLTSLMH